MRVKEVVDIMYSPDNFSPPPMEDMSPTSGINSSFQLFEERVSPFVVFVQPAEPASQI